MLKNDRDFEKVAQSIISETNNKKQIIVLSAPFAHTDQLLKDSLNISSDPDPKFQALLLATGEQISLSKIGLYLQEKKIKANYLYGSEIPLYTENKSLDSRVHQVDKKKILKSLEEYDVLLIAGFQGLNLNSKHLTTLGRGGSDLTASVLSAALNCPCFFYKDSGGIGQSYQGQYNKIYENLTFNEIIELSQNGSKVIYDEAALLLSQYQIPAYFGSLENPQRTQVFSVSKDKIDNIIHSKHCFRLEVFNEHLLTEFIDSAHFKKKFHLLTLFSQNNRKYLIFEKKHSESLDKSYFYKVNCFNIGKVVPISVIHITGNGLLHKSNWFIKLMQDFEHYISSINFNQFKVSIIMDDIEREDTLRLIDRLNQYVSQSVSS